MRSLQNVHIFNSSQNMMGSCLFLNMTKNRICVRIINRRKEILLIYKTLILQMLEILEGKKRENVQPDISAQAQDRDFSSAQNSRFVYSQYSIFLRLVYSQG